MPQPHQPEDIMPPTPELIVAVGASLETSAAELCLQPVESQNGNPVQFAMPAAALRSLIDRSEPDALITFTPHNMRPFTGYTSAFPEVPEDAAFDFASGRISVKPATGEVTVDGKLVSFGPMRFRLLAKLAMNSHRAVPHGELIETMWPENPEDNKENMQRLRMNVSEARGQLQGCDTVLGSAIRTVSGIGYRAMPRINM